MAEDIFLKIEGIAGESIDDKHKGEIDVLAWQWGLKQSGTTHISTGGGAGKVAINDLVVTKLADKATPNLIKYGCSGKHIGEVQLTVRKAGGKPLEYVKITLKNVIISSYSTGAARSDDRLVEQVGFNFAEVKFSYVPQKADGSGEASVDATWNIPKNAEA